MGKSQKHKDEQKKQDLNNAYCLCLFMSKIDKSDL